MLSVGTPAQPVQLPWPSNGAAEIPRMRRMQRALQVSDVSDVSDGLVTNE